MITVFYDGKCGLCATEIHHYRKIAPVGIFDWQDITQSSDVLGNEGISFAEGLKYLHVKDAEGQFHIGVDAFIVIWQQLKRWRVLAVIVALPIVRHIVGALYNLFAKWRFRKLEHCQLAAKQEEQ